MRIDTGVGWEWRVQWCELDDEDCSEVFEDTQTVELVEARIVRED
jgi:hypothetical protein